MYDDKAGTTRRGETPRAALLHDKAGVAVMQQLNTFLLLLLAYYLFKINCNHLAVVNRHTFRPPSHITASVNISAPVCL